MPEMMAPPNAAGVELCYETFGDPRDPTILLVMGLATQMIAWDTRFCEMLAEHGFHVVRFDNRDVGRSSRWRGRPPTIKQLFLRDKRAARYTLTDMADDALSLLDYLEVKQAHIVGASMGGMIAQTIAIEHPERVLSLVSIMSNAGGRLRGQPKLAVYPIFLKRAPMEREAYARHIAKLYKVIGSPDYRPEDELVIARARDAWDRGVDAAGSGRQLAAVMASPNRRRRLREIKAPTLVIHGTADPLVAPSGGREVAKAIPRAELLLVNGMGHDLPAGLWPTFVNGIVATAKRAAATTATQPAAAR